MPSVYTVSDELDNENHPVDIYCCCPTRALAEREARRILIEWGRSCLDGVFGTLTLDGINYDLYLRAIRAGFLVMESFDTLNTRHRKPHFTRPLTDDEVLIISEEFMHISRPQISEVTWVDS